MRKVILWAHVSLDGFTSGPNGELDWLTQHVTSEEGWESLNRTTRTVDTVLLGRVNYEAFFHYWPTVAEHRSNPHDADFAHWLNTVRKVVYSRTLTVANWENTTLFQTIERDEVVRLKESEGGDILILNSASIAGCLMLLGLVDELRINIFPIVLGGRKPLFRDLHRRVDLRLLETKTSPYGVVECIYGIPAYPGGFNELKGCDEVAANVQ